MDVSSLIAQLLPVVAGFIATVTFQVVKHAVTALDAAPAIVKQILVVVLAALLTWLGAVLGVPLPTDIHAINPTVWTGLVAGALSLAYHALFKGAAESAT